MTFEEQLVNQAIQGSRQAFDMLVERHYAGVYRYVRRHAGSPDDASDMTQNAFVKAFTRLNQLAAPDKFETWLRQIALNECRMAHRRNGADEVSLDAIDACDDSSRDSAGDLITPSTEDHVLGKESWRSVLRAIDALPDRDRAIAHAFFVEEQPYAQIETEQGVSHGALGMRLHRIRKALAQRLGLTMLGLLAFPRRLRGQLSGGDNMSPIAITCKAVAVFSVSAIVWFGFNNSAQGGNTSGGDYDLAQRELCANNLKQLGLALHQYADANDGKLPASSQWCDAVAPYTDLVEEPVHCPVAGQSQYGYAMNQNLSGGRLTDVKNPAQTVLLYEARELRHNASGDGKDLASRHEEGLLLLYADGHVAWHPLNMTQNFDPSAAGIGEDSAKTLGSRPVRPRATPSSGSSLKELFHKQNPAEFIPDH